MTTRACGACQLCCKLMPIEETKKEAGVRCSHQRHRKGCAIYADRPDSCRWWSCVWLLSPELPDLRRPDVAGYVIDPTADFMTLQGGPTGDREEALRMIQVWCDPKRPDAHRDPALRAYLADMFLEGYVGVARFGRVDGLALIPPMWSGKGWVEFPTTSEGRQHSLAEYISRFGADNLPQAMVDSMRAALP